MKPFHYDQVLRLRDLPLNSEEFKQALRQYPLMSLIEATKLVPTQKGRRQQLQQEIGRRVSQAAGEDHWEVRALVPERQAIGGTAYWTPIHAQNGRAVMSEAEALETFAQAQQMNWRVRLVQVIALKLDEYAQGQDEPQPDPETEPPTTAPGEGQH